jgi:hypothetical protein
MNDDPNRPARPHPDARERMQRVRVGLTGLAVVLLIVALATALFRQVGDQIPANASRNEAALDATSKDEPLADLGVAPGAAADGEQTLDAGNAAQK